MAKTTVEVKQYKRKDGTVVRGSTRKLTKAEKLKRKQSLGNHIKKGAKISGAITGSLGALQGAAYGGALGGPVGALVGAGVGGATSAVGGAASGAGYGAGVYGVKRAMAKRRDPKGFKKSFDYSRNIEYVKMFIGQQDESSINFARPKGAKDKMPRKKSGLRTAAKVGAGLAGAAGIGAAGLAAVKNRKAIGGALRNAGGAVRDTASSAVGSARQKVGGKLDAMGSKMQRKGAYDRQHAATDWDLTDREAIKQVKRANTRSAVGSKLRSVASKIRGN